MVNQHTLLRHWWFWGLWLCNEGKRKRIVLDCLVKYNPVHGPAEVNVHLLLQNLYVVIQTENLNLNFDLTILLQILQV